MRGAEHEQEATRFCEQQFLPQVRAAVESSGTAVEHIVCVEAAVDIVHPPDADGVTLHAYLCDRYRHSTPSEWLARIDAGVYPASHVAYINCSMTSEITAAR